MASHLLLNPSLLRLFTGSLHLILLLGAIVSWVCGKIRGNGDEGRKQSVRHTKLLFYRPTLYSCLSLSLFNLALCLFYCFYWYTNGRSDEKIVILVDLGVKTVAWFYLSRLLKHQLLNVSERKYPIVLRLWWGLFVLVSCYCLVTDILYYKKYQTLPALFWASDVVSLVMGLVLCYFGFHGECEATVLEEPLLNGSDTNDRESNEFSRGEETVTPFESAGIFSTLTFSWVSPLVSLGYNRRLNLEDIPQLSTFDSVRTTYPAFNDKLESGRVKSNRVTATMLAKALIYSTRWEIGTSAVYVIIFTLASYVGPYLIDDFVQYLNGHQDVPNEGYILVSAFTISKVLQCLAQRQYYLKVQQAGYRARAALVSKIYNKGLSLSSQSKKVHTTGEIINFMAVDAERIGTFSWYVHDPWTIILDVCLALVILYRTLRLASLATLAATILVMLLNIPLGKLEKKFQDKLMKSKDERMKSTTEVLKNMRILKLQAWEMKFLSKIIELRNAEAGWLRKYLYTTAIIAFVFWGTPAFVSVSTFGTCLLMGIPLESGKILSALATFRILQDPMYSLPGLISMIVQTKVSLDRVASFLSLDELQPDVVEKLPVSNSEIALEITDASFVWDVSSPTPTLEDINFRVSRGMRVAICGTVGSGKSSLLSCILGEMQKLSGTVRVSGTKAYVAQSPWIRGGTIEENILFCKEMDRERYNRVLGACSLKKDLEILAFGDQTIIGERGINLSGGQKQRVQIARALYQDADVYLFDDPFSAVDAHTGSHLFNECIWGLLDSKTVIYVTHQMEFLPAADLILVMRDGKINQIGKYGDILKSGSDFKKLVGAHEEAMSAIGSTEVRKSASPEGRRDAYAKKLPEEQGSQDGNNVDNYKEKSGQLVQEEERGEGRVGFSVYWSYITTAYRGLLVPFILLAQSSFQLLQIGSNYWLASATPVSTDVAPPVASSTLMLVYIALAIGSSFCILARALLLVTASFKTTTILFKKMHLSIFRAPMSFFDSTPSSRILNRASTDQSTVDLDLAYLVGQFAFAIIQLLGIIGVVSQVAWQVFFIFIPVLAICIWLEQYYVPSGRELARLCGLYKAPVLQHFSETLSGAETIRSFDQESNFRDLSMKLIDGYARPRFHGAAAMEWLSLRVDMLSLLTFAFAFGILISLPIGTVDPSIAGLAVTYGLSLNALQSWIVWTLSNMETKIISVERILQYSSIPSEPPLAVESNRPQSHWPTHGEVSIQDLQVRYAPHMPLVLRGLTCTFFGEKKTGIVGRTGSGKSTLIQTLFRIVEPAGGQISIDGINILSIGLHDLRSRLSIIPQEPTMFEGTVRSNLDPLEEYTDEQIWEALDKCQLGDKVREKQGKLDSSVSENGENWSVGQRQLVCLGRVLLKKSKILVLDEATASVDTATDSLIQQTLKQHFSDSTVITIAHRITSVVDSAMVLLLDNGRLKEYDSPDKLLEDKSSFFAKLVAEYSMRSSSSR